MKISDLIKSLERDLEKYGDKEIYSQPDYNLNNLEESQKEIRLCSYLYHEIYNFTIQQKRNDLVEVYQNILCYNLAHKIDDIVSKKISKVIDLAIVGRNNNQNVFLNINKNNSNGNPLSLEIKEENTIVNKIKYYFGYKEIKESSIEEFILTHGRGDKVLIPNKLEEILDL